MINQITAEQLHSWYLEAIANLDEWEYNLSAAVPFSELTRKQKYIDEHIAIQIRAAHDKDKEKWDIDNAKLKVAYHEIVEIGNREHKKAMNAIKDKLKHAQIIICERGNLACGKCFYCKELNKVFADSNTNTKEAKEQ